jgi:hypothetical protein
MAALTWKNVDAPTLGGAGDLFNAANASFGNAMEILRATAEQQAGQKRAATSAQMLAQLAGATDPTQVGQLIQQFNPEELSPEALQIAMSQPGVLLDRQMKGVELENARGDLLFDQNTREGQAQAASVRAQAQAMSMTDPEGAAKLLASLENPFALTAAIGDFSTFSGNAQSQLNLEKDEYSFGRTIDENNLDDFATTYFQNKVMANAINKNQARAFVMNDQTLQPKEREKLLAQVEASSDEQYQIVDPYAQDMFSNTELGQTVTNAGQFVQTDIQSQLEQSPRVRYQTMMENMESDNGEEGSGFIDPAKFLEEQIGLEPSLWAGWTPEQSINRVVADAAKDGINITPREAAAAIATSYQLGGLGTNRRVADPEAALNIIKDQRDPEKIKESQARDNFFTQYADKAQTAESKIQALMADYTQYVNRGMTDKAAKTTEQIISAQEGLAALYQEYQNKRDEVVGAPPPPAPSAAARAVSTAAQGIGSTASTMSQMLEAAAGGRSNRATGVTAGNMGVLPETLQGLGAIPTPAPSNNTAQMEEILRFLATQQ